MIKIPIDDERTGQTITLKLPRLDDKIGEPNKREKTRDYFQKVVDHHVDINLYINEAYSSFKRQEETLNNIQETKLGNGDIENLSASVGPDRSNRSTVHSRHTGRNFSHVTSMESDDSEDLGLLNLGNIFDEARFTSAIENYEGHYVRHYFSDREGYDANQPELEDDYNLRKQLQEHLEH